MAINDYSIRPISENDNPGIAAVIRKVLVEFNANKPGTAWTDPELDNLSQAYQGERYHYWVITHGEEVVGGAGIAPLAGASEQQAELQKMYLLSEARGTGCAQGLLDTLIKLASNDGYRTLYLETLPNMEQANRFYQKNGFKRIEQRLGATGHNQCDVLYLRQL